MSSTTLQVLGWSIYLAFICVFSFIMWAEWRIHDTLFTTLGSSALILLIITLLLPLALWISIFRGDGVPEKRWSYRFISMYECVNHHISERVNVCDIVPLTGLALSAWFVVLPFCFVMIVFLWIISFSWGERPALLRGDPDWEDDDTKPLFVPYQRWLRIRGWRILPIVPMLVVLAVIGTPMIASRLAAWFKTTALITSGPYGTWIGIAGVSVTVVITLIIYGRTERGRETRDAVRMFLRSKLDRFCVAQPVIKAEDNR